MGVRAIVSGDGTRAAMYCSTTGIAFGPVFEGDEAEEQLAAFLAWLDTDPRLYPPHRLTLKYEAWQKQALDTNGYLRV